MPTATPTKPSQAGTQPKKPPLTMRQKAFLARQHARTAHHHTRGVQKQAAPFVGMGLLVLAATALHAAKDATAADAEILGSTAAVCVVVAVVAAKQMNKRLDDRKALHRGLAFVTTAAGWLTYTTAFGVTWDAVGFLVAVGSVLSLHWWRQHRIPNQTNLPVIDFPDPPAADEVSYYQRRWDEYVACAGGQLPGSRLESPEQVKAGWRYVLRLVPGKQSIASLMSAMVLIRGGLGLTIDQDVIAEKHPVLAEPAVQLTVVTKPQVRDDQEWPGPQTFQDGYVDMGPFIDGEGHARWKVYSKDRMFGGYIQGGSGAGKSRLIESIVMPIADSQTHPTVFWYADGQGGSSSPTLMRHADYAARTHEQTKQLFACAMLIVELRQDENSVLEVLDENGDFEDTIGFVPAADRPGLLIVYDECHKGMSKVENADDWLVIQYMIMTIAREGQKVGVQVICASQESTLGAFGGAGNNAEMVRSNLLMGNGVMMRSKDANARQVFKVDDDPSQFPPIPGYALLVDPEEGARTAPFRAYFLTNTLRKEWPAKIRWRSLDRGTANAAGTFYLHRRELAQMAKEEVRRRIEARRAGNPTESGVDRILATASASAQGGDGSAALGDLPEVADFPVWNPVTGKVQAKQMRDGHRKVLDALKAGFSKPTPIAEATGYSSRQVHNLLDELIDEFGKVERVIRPEGPQKHGEYRLVEDATW